MSPDMRLSSVLCGHPSIRLSLDQRPGSQCLTRTAGLKRVEYTLSPSNRHHTFRATPNPASPPPFSLPHIYFNRETLHLSRRWSETSAQPFVGAVTGSRLTNRGDFQGLGLISRIIRRARGVGGNSFDALGGKEGKERAAALGSDLPPSTNSRISPPHISLTLLYGSVVAPEATIPIA